MDINSGIKLLLNKLNAEAIVSSGNGMYFDGDAAFILIKQFVDAAIVNAVRDVAGSDAIDEVVPKRGPGRPKAE